MDNTKLAEIKSRAEAATAGPWRHWREAGDIEITTDGYKEPIVSKVRPRLGWGEKIYVDNQEPDAEFIAHAREDIPALIAALEAAEAELTRRDTVIAEAHRVVDEFLDGTSEGVGPLAHVAENAIAAIHEVLAGAPVSLEAVKAETTTEWLPERIHWGVQAGGHPARLAQYQTRDMAEWYLVHPFPADEGLKHVLVTRKTRETAWRPVETEGDNRV